MTNTRNTRSTSDKTNVRLGVFRKQLLRTYNGVPTSAIRKLLCDNHHPGFRTRLELLLKLHEKRATARLRSWIRTAVHKRRLVRHLVRRVRNKPINKTCPILLDELQSPVFRYVTPGPTHKVYAYNLEPLVKYVVASMRFVDPMSGVSFNEIEVMRLQNMRNKHLPQLHAQVDLRKLAFDERYRARHEATQEVLENSREGVRFMTAELMMTLHANMWPAVIARYMTALIYQHNAFLNRFSMIDAEAALAVMNDTVQTLEQIPGCPARIIRLFTRNRDIVRQRRDSGLHAYMVPESDEGDDDDVDIDVSEQNDGTEPEENELPEALSNSGEMLVSAFLQDISNDL